MINNKLCFGTANFVKEYGINKSKGYNHKKIKAIFSLLKRNKIKNIDTAINYKNVEKKIGKFNLDSFKIYTKIPKVPKKIENIDLWIRNQIKHSLNKTKKSFFEGVFLHNSEDLLKNKKNQIYDSLANLKKEKKLKKIGLSIYDLNTLKKITKEFKIDMIQIPYNLLDRGKKKKQLLNKLKKNNIEIHVRSIFLQGILLMDSSKLPLHFKKWENKFIMFENWCIKNKISKIQACLNVVLEDKLFNKVVISAENEKQLVQILNAINKKNKKDYPKNLQTNEKKLIDPRLWKRN
jgi:aryl-alcohol dehydrogenase-like predicted oxidoreductase